MFLTLILIGGIFLYLNKEKLSGLAIEKSVEIIERMVLQNLPQSISQESVNAVFSKAVNRIKKGEVNQPKLQQFLLTFQTQFQRQNVRFSGSP